MTPSIDLVLREARPFGSGERVVDIGISRRPHCRNRGRPCLRRARASPGRTVGRAGFVETHIHLDKSCIIERCTLREGTLAEAMAETSAAKRGFSEDDIYARASRTLAKAIAHGTTRVRTHVEIDPAIGLKGFNAIRKLKQDFAWAVDLEICVFPQEGLLNNPGTEELLVEACQIGADSIGGCPYVDTDPAGHIDRIFALAGRFNLAIDLHLDFDLDPSWMHLDEVLQQTHNRRWVGASQSATPASCPPSTSRRWQPLRDASPRPVLP
jgi:cytosine deaminase